jgi:hypothetical protein
MNAEVEPKKKALEGRSRPRPLIPGSTLLADYISGLYGALGALIAYIGRQRPGGAKPSRGLRSARPQGDHPQRPAQAFRNTRRVEMARAGHGAA